MIKIRSELERLGFEVKNTNDYRPNNNVRLYAIKGDIVYLGCNKCGDGAFKPIDAFGKATGYFMEKKNFCRKCLHAKMKTYRKQGTSLTGDEFDFSNEKQINCKLEPTFDGKYRIIFTVGNSCIWDYATNRTYDYFQQAREAITITLTKNLALRSV